jgi:hypothetical protein
LLAERKIVTRIYCRNIERKGRVIFIVDSLQALLVGKDNKAIRLCTEVYEKWGIQKPPVGIGYS